MKRIILLTCLLCIFSVEQMAQTISGTVFDAVNTPISYATVVLCNAKDTTQVAYTITDDDGKFSITSSSLSHKVTDYLLQVSYIGYKSVYAQAQSTQEIILEQDVLAFDEAVVKGARSISKITAGGVLTTIENTAISGIGTGNDVLERIPMITGGEGRYEVFGRGEAKIYINNREVRDPSEIDNLNSSDIQSVEVVSNPGAKYDASVKAVINIRTVKRQGDGFSFNARASFYTWDNEDYINQLNTNYRSGGLDVFANMYYSNITSYQKGDISQTVSIDTVWHQENNMQSDMYINRLNTTLGFNYNISTKHSLGLRYDLKSSLNENIQDLKMSSNIYANNILYNNVYNNEYQRTKNKPKSQANLYYNGVINKLNVDFNYDFLSNKDEINSINNETIKESDNNKIMSNSTINNMVSATRLQITYPIWEGELMVGSEYVYVKRNDSYANYTYDSFSSDVELLENNFSLFAQYVLALEKMGNFSVGLRYEYDKYDYYVDDVKNPEISKLYKQLFPSFSYSKRLGEIMIKLDYSNKIARPLYNQLGASLLYGNYFTLLSGNPYLKPTISNDVSLSSIWRFFQAQINYTHQNNVITMWVDRYENDPKISIITYKNINQLQRLSAFIGISYRFELWKPTLNLGIQKQWLNLSKYGIEQKLNNPNYTISLDNIFELKNGYIFNLDGKYTSKGAFLTNYSYIDYFELDFGVSKRFFRDALQVKLAVTDVFNQRVQAHQTYSLQTYMKTLFHYDTREVSLSIRYNFNSAKNRYKGEGAGEDAKQRL